MRWCALSRARYVVCRRALASNQYTRARSGVELPKRQRYSNTVTEQFAADREAHLVANARFRRIDLHWCLTLEPSQIKAFRRRPEENAAENFRMLAELQKSASLLVGHLEGLLGFALLDKQSTFQFLSYLLNLQDGAEWDCIREDEGIDRQIVRSPVAWHHDHP